MAVLSSVFMTIRRQTGSLFSPATIKTILSIVIYSPHCRQLFMRIPRIFTAQALSENHQVQLEEQASLHLIKVLRMSEGDQLTLFNGQGGEYLGHISKANKKSAEVQIDCFNDKDSEAPLAIHIAVGISKGDKMEWLIQKATELGVKSISPLSTEHSDVKMNQERAAKKQLQWQQVAISACEQSGRNFVPEVKSVQDFFQWHTQLTESDSCCIFHTEGGRPISQLKPNTQQALHFCFGPEGGFSPKEINSLKQEDHLLTLGQRILRAETAPVASIGAALTLWGDW